MTMFNKLSGASDLRKDAPPGDDPLAQTVARLAANVSELLKPTRLEKGAMVERIHMLGDKIREDVEQVKEAIEAKLRDLTKQNSDARKQFLCGRTFALNPDDPAALEIVGEALRRDPGLLAKINRTN